MRPLNILADFHHPDLWWSLHLLFEKRLGWKLFRPEGMGYFEGGYHYINDEGHGFHTARGLSKYLLEDTLFKYRDYPDYRFGLEAAHGCEDFPPFRVLPFKRLGKTPIDILLCSTHCNEKPTKKLQQDFYPEAKIIRQVGNQMEEVDPKICPNVLCSDVPSFAHCKSENKLFYHQEFDLDLAFYEPPESYEIISCFINHFYLDTANFELFEAVEELLPDWRFFSYGEGNFDGKIWRKQDEIGMMKKSKFVWQTKSWDGYGFNIHRAYALGRPVICHSTDYVGKTAEPLLTDKETCIFIEDTPKETAKKIQHFAEPKRHKEMCENARRRFLEVVNFDKEFEEIKGFLGRLI